MSILTLPLFLVPSLFRFFRSEASLLRHGPGEAQCSIPNARAYEPRGRPMSFLNGSRRIQRIHERQRSARRWTGAAREWIRAVCDRADRQSALRGRPDAARKLLLALVGMLLKLPRPRRGSYGEEV